MAKMLYFECAAGISGDMSVAALLDLGADRTALDRAIGSLSIGGFETKISRVKKSGIDVCDFNVITEIDNHDHDMEYLHGHTHEHEHEHEHEHIHEHEHEHEHGHEHEHIHEHEHMHEHEHGHHGHTHRGLAEITSIINSADMTDGAKALAHRIFRIIAEAEAKAHAAELENVHFHEVGAVDSIVDIIAFAVCYDDLGIGETIIPALTEGGGFVRCQHGIIPVPVPAVTNIAQMNGLTLKISGAEGELVTPTGAAIAAAVKTSDKLPRSFRVIKCGMGAGKREYEIPGILRVMIIETDDEESLYKLETNIDDCPGEALGYVMEKLFAAGANDVYYTPVYMKKNRPAYVLSVICRADRMGECENIIFRHTTTIGIRRVRIERSVLERTSGTVRTSLGDVNVKKCGNGDDVRVYPEYESVREICERENIGYPDAYRRIFAEISKA